MWNVPEGVVTARGHMLLLVHAEGGPYLADVGFGGLTLTAPLVLRAGVEQATPHEDFRLVTSGDGYVMQARLGDAWKPLYRFTLEEQYAPDYEVSSWFLATNPRSHFLTGLMAARPAPEARYALRNTMLMVHHRDGRTERRELAGATELREVLRGTFGIDAPDGLEDAFERIIAPAAAAAV
jgi:N-hydroxyarylamine O-acetyltransferase